MIKENIGHYMEFFKLSDDDLIHFLKFISSGVSDILVI